MYMYVCVYIYIYIYICAEAGFSAKANFLQLAVWLLNHVLTLFVYVELISCLFSCFKQQVTRHT